MGAESANRKNIFMLTEIVEVGEVDAEYYPIGKVLLKIHQGEMIGQRINACVAFKTGVVCIFEEKHTPILLILQELKETYVPLDVETMPMSKIFCRCLDALRKKGFSGSDGAEAAIEAFTAGKESGNGFIDYLKSSLDLLDFANERNGLRQTFTSQFGEAIAYGARALGIQKPAEKKE